MTPSETPVPHHARHRLNPEDDKNPRWEPCRHIQLGYWLADQGINLKWGDAFDRMLKALDVLGIDKLGPAIVEATKTTGTAPGAVLDEIARRERA